MTVKDRARVSYDDCLCACHFSTVRRGMDVDRGVYVTDEMICDPCQRANDRDYRERVWDGVVYLGGTTTVKAVVNRPSIRRVGSAAECIIRDRWHVCS